MRSHFGRERTEASFLVDVSATLQQHIDARLESLVDSYVQWRPPRFVHGIHIEAVRIIFVVL
jgi:hypothetical protein